MGSKAKQHCLIVIDSKDREVVKRQRGEEQKSANYEGHESNIRFNKISHGNSTTAQSPRNHLAFGCLESAASCRGKYYRR